MTDSEYKRLKREQKELIYNSELVIDLYTEVEMIEILYTIEHTSAFGRIISKDTREFVPHNKSVFVIECINKECSSIGFDLREVISQAIRDHKSVITGTMECNGQEAPDHPEQGCGSVMEYIVKLYYKS